MTYPNEEQLEMIIKLQPFLKEKLKHLHSYDDCCCLEKDILIRLDCDYLCPDIGCKEIECKNRILLPHAIDPVNPERGLWGMIDWKRYSIATTCENGNIQIIVISNDEDFSTKVIKPTTALLKALCHQEGL
jgi:hypothetical protein